MGLHQIGKRIFHLVNTNKTNSKKIAKNKREATRLDILAKLAKVNEIKVLGKTLVSLTIEQLKMLLVTLRYHKNKKIPTKNRYLFLCLVK